MNVCIVSSWLPSKDRPYFAPFVYNFAENLARFGINAFIIGPSTKMDESVFNTGLMKIYRINASFPMLSMLRLFDKLKPDLIHVHAPNFFSCNAIPIAKLKKIPIIATVHRAEVEKVNNPMFFFRKHALARFKRIIAVSNHTKLLALMAGVNPSKITIIHNSCDEVLFLRKTNKNSVRKRNNLQANDKVVLFVGNLIKRKGVHYLIESLNLIRDSLNQCIVIIVGHGEELDNLKSMASSYGLKNHVKFYGRINDIELSELFSAADVFVLPSTSEGHSVAILEAMASGLPVIASDIQANKESIEDGINGFLFKSGDASNLAEKLLTILTDNMLRQEMAERSYRIYLERFSVKNQIDRHVFIYKTLIENR